MESISSRRRASILNDNNNNATNTNKNLNRRSASLTVQKNRFSVSPARPLDFQQAPQLQNGISKTPPAPQQQQQQQQHHESHDDDDYHDFENLDHVVSKKPSTQSMNSNFTNTGVSVGPTILEDVDEEHEKSPSPQADKNDLQNLADEEKLAILESERLEQKILEERNHNEQLEKIERDIEFNKDSSAGEDNELTQNIADSLPENQTEKKLDISEVYEIDEIDEDINGAEIDEEDEYTSEEKRQTELKLEELVHQKELEILESIRNSKILSGLAVVSSSTASNRTITPTSMSFNHNSPSHKNNRISMDRASSISSLTSSQYAELNLVHEDSLPNEAFKDHSYELEDTLDEEFEDMPQVDEINETALNVDTIDNGEISEEKEKEENLESKEKEMNNEDDLKKMKY
ncbi:unnamed protein product [[Candida] boidinii]|nr:unnamed protein product [[Candida] boidinii]